MADRDPSEGISAREDGEDVNDSDVRERLDAKHEGDRERRIEAIKRWVEYIQSEPPEVWGPQQNAVVNGQLDAAQSTNTSAAHQQHIRAVAKAINDDCDANDANDANDARGE
ncbi:MAG TPA: hypothetical protein VFJ06_05365 [Halococcus sp.]|nr:hypothetical protein [Halococcus sp.]